VEDSCIELCGNEGERRIVELIVAVNEASRMTGGGGNSCGAATSVLWPPYIRPGWCEEAHRRMASIGGNHASM
jgi:hypothetical protein